MRAEFTHLGAHPAAGFQLHRALFPRSRPRRRLRPVPAARPTSRARARSTRNHVGGTLRASYPLTENWRHGLRFTVREDAISDVDNSASRFIKDEEGEDLTVLVGQNLTYDVRDTRFLPSEGYLVAARAGSSPGSATPSSAPRADRRPTTTPSRPTGCSTSQRRGGHIFGYGGENVGLFDRFFLGGQTLRGFKFAGVGPRDVTTDDALGGNRPVHRHGRAALPARPARGAADLRPGVRRGRHAHRARRQRPGDRRQRQHPGRRPASACPGCRRSARSRSTCRRHFSRRKRTRPSSSASASARASERAKARRDDRPPAPAAPGRGPAVSPRCWPPPAAVGDARAQQLPPTVAAVIDYQRIIREAAAARSISEQIEARRKAYQEEISKEEQRLHEADKAFAKQRSLLTPEAFAEKRREFEQEVAEVQRLVQERRRALDSASAEALDEVKSALIEVVTSIAEERGFNLVLPSSEVLFFSRRIDRHRRGAGQARRPPAGRAGAAGRQLRPMGDARFFRRRRTVRARRARGAGRGAPRGRRPGAPDRGRRAARARRPGAAHLPRQRPLSRAGREHARRRPAWSARPMPRACRTAVARLLTAEPYHGYARVAAAFSSGRCGARCRGIRRRPASRRAR